MQTLLYKRIAARRQGANVHPPLESSLAMAIIKDQQFIMKPRQDDLKCPVCASAQYTKVKIELPDGEIYGTDVYRCAQCSFRFIDRVQHAYLEAASGYR